MVQVWGAGTDGATTAMTARIGVGVVVVRDGLVLVGLRRGAHGSGTWALPGGHPAPGESLAACALRELAEETGLRAASATPCHRTRDVIDGVDYLTHFLLVADAIGEPERREPHKCAEWRWCRWDALPAPLFPPLASLYRAGFRPPGPLSPEG